VSLGFTSLDSGEETASDGTIVTSSESPPDNAVLLLTVVATTASSWGGSPPTVSPSGLGGTWTQLDSVIYGDRRSIQLYRGTKATSWGTGTITVTVSGGGGSLQDVAWALDQVTGQDTTTPNDTASAETGTDNLTMTDVFTVDAGDAIYAVGGHEDGLNNFALTGYTPITTLQSLSNVRQIRSYFDDTSPDETPNWTSDGGGNTIGAIACVINVGAAVAGGDGARFSNFAVQPMLRGPF
jgi:hypothetical protein